MLDDDFIDEDYIRMLLVALTYNYCHKANSSNLYLFQRRK